MSEAPTSLGISQPKFSYDLLRKPAAKVVFLGDASVGKSSIIAFLQNGYTTDKVKQRATVTTTPIGELSLKVEEGKVRLELWDTCGQEQFRTITNNFFRGAHGAVLVYDVTREETLTNLFEPHEVRKEVIPSWLDNFLDHFKETNPSVAEAHIAVLGNKADLKQKISAEQAQETIGRAMKARGLKYIFYETSAHTGQNLDEAAKQFASKFKGNLTPALPRQSPEPTPACQPQPKRSGCC